MELYAHQTRFLSDKRKKCLLAWGTGTGKTLTSLEWAKLWSGKVLVICPKPLRENWLRNVSAHGLEATVLTKEELRRDWEKLPAFNIVINDEAHNFAGQKSQMSKNFRKYLKKHKVEHCLLLTATPYMSSPWNIYVLAGHLGYEWGYFSFRERFFRDRYIGRRVVPEVKPGMEGEIAKLVAHIGDVVHIEECADIPEQSFEVEYYKLTPEQEKAIKENPETNPIVRWTKNHQIEQGAVKGNEFEEGKFYKNNKLERILDLCREHKKIAIVCRYNLQIDMYAKAITEELGKKVWIIRGDVDNRDEVVTQVEKEDEAIVLLNAYCSEGYEIPSIGLMVFASLDFSYKNYSQMIGRILRLNKLKRNVYLFLVVEDGVDEGVYDSVKRKEDFDVAIYSRNKGNMV